jgi:hypothetical protein
VYHVACQTDVDTVYILALMLRIIALLKIQVFTVLKLHTSKWAKYFQIIKLKKCTRILRKEQVMIYMIWPLQYLSPYYYCLNNAGNDLFAYFFVLYVEWNCRVQSVSYFLCSLYHLSNFSSKLAWTWRQAALIQALARIVGYKAAGISTFICCQ